jgi:hypothetical protein
MAKYKQSNFEQIASAIGVDVGQIAITPRQRTLLGAVGMSGLVPEAVTSTAAAAAASRYLPFAILAPDFKGTNFI